MVDIFEHYCKGDKAVARMLTIYIEEAHPRDEWWLPDSPEASGKRCVYVHKTIDERLAAARRFIEGNSFPIELVCDTMKGEVYDRYQAWPERLYIILNGVVVYRGGEGPFGYKLPEVKQWLANKFGMRGELIFKVADDNSCCSR
jgi:hypothetical protein